LNDRVEKKPRRASHCKHLYPTIPTDADDDESLKRNMDKLKEEMDKLKPIPEVIKKSFSTDLFSKTIKNT